MFKDETFHDITSCLLILIYKNIVFPTSCFYVFITFSNLFSFPGFLNYMVSRNVSLLLSNPVYPISSFPSYKVRGVCVNVSILLPFRPQHSPVVTFPVKIILHSSDIPSVTFIWNLSSTIHLIPLELEDSSKTSVLFSTFTNLVPFTWSGKSSTTTCVWVLTH